MNLLNWKAGLLIASLAANAGVAGIVASNWSRTSAGSDASETTPTTELVRLLNLDPARRDALAAAKKAYLEKSAPLREDFIAQRAELGRLLRKPGIAETEVAGALARYHRAQAALQSAAITHVLTQARQLDPAQRDAFVELATRRLLLTPGAPSNHLKANPVSKPEQHQTGQP